MDMPKRATQSAGSGIGSDNYLKIGDGEKIEVVFRGNFYEFWQSWPKGGDKQVFTEPTAGSKSRFLINAIVKADNKLVAKVWEFASPTYDVLAEINEHYPLETTKIQIARSGTSTKTRYSVIPLGPVDPKAIKLIAAVELHPLDRSQTPEAAPASADGEIYF